MSKLIVYHKNCTDGTTAAAIAMDALTKNGHAPELFAATYGDAPPPVDMVAGKDIYIVDFSYPRSILVAMKDAAKSLVVLDHHKTAATELAGLDFAQFDMDRSGAGMAWDYFHPGTNRPKLVEYVEDRDLWRFAYGDQTRNFFAAMEFDMNEIEEPEDRVEYVRVLLGGLDEVDTRTMIEEGNVLRRHFQGFVDGMIPYAYRVELLGVPMMACNATGAFASELGNALVKEYRMPACIWYSDGKEVKLMFRSDDALHDVSEVARAFGGGGHRNAAGCKVGLNFMLEVGALHEEVKPVGHELEAAGESGVKVWDVRDGDMPPGLAPGV